MISYMNDKEELSDITLRADGRPVGIFSRKRRVAPIVSTPSKPDPVPLTHKQAAAKIARAWVEESVQVTEEKANALALEHISNAAERFKKNSEMRTIKPKKARDWLWFLHLGKK